MRLHYDPAADALYLRFAEAEIVESEEVRPGIILDFDAADRVVAIEILNVRAQFPDADVKRFQLDVA